MTLKQLRKIINESLNEVGGGAPTKPMFNYTRNAMAPSRSDREQLGALAQIDIDTEDELASHLLEPEVDYHDCFGPVPPTEGEPLVMQDPFVRQSSPLPTPQR